MHDLIEFSQHPQGIDFKTVPTFYVKKLRLRNVKWLALASIDGSDPSWVALMPPRCGTSLSAIPDLFSQTQPSPQASVLTEGRLHSSQNVDTSPVLGPSLDLLHFSLLPPLPRLLSRSLGPPLLLCQHSGSWLAHVTPPLCTPWPAGGRML